MATGPSTTTKRSWGSLPTAISHIAVGDAGETRWATDEYHSLLAATTRTLDATIHRYDLDYLPCSMVEPNTANRCGNPEDANWAAPFLFGRWAWDAQLFGAAVSGPGRRAHRRDLRLRLRRLAGKLPAEHVRRVSRRLLLERLQRGLRQRRPRQHALPQSGHPGYEFMIAHTQSGPYSWWESASAPSAASPWIGSHPAAGRGSSPHAWGIANANKVLLDSIVAQAATAC